MTPRPFDLDAACAAALKRLQESLNRSAAQHQMHLRRLAIAIRARPLLMAESRASSIDTSHTGETA